MKASLISLDGGPSIEIVKDVTVIGRKDFCDIRLEDPSISKVHLVLVRTDDVLIFRDMGSTNGTKVNGQRVVRGVLMPNDKLTIAACKYQVQISPNGDSVIAQESGPPAAEVNGSSPVVRIYKAEELAMRSQPEYRAPSDTPPEIIQEQPGERRPAKKGYPAAPPARYANERQPNAAPEFVD